MTVKGARLVLAGAHNLTRTFRDHPRVTGAQTERFRYNYVSDYVSPIIALTDEICKRDLKNLPDTLAIPLAAFVKFGRTLAVTKARKKELLNARKKLGKIAAKIDVEN